MYFCKYVAMLRACVSTNTEQSYFAAMALLTCFIRAHIVVMLECVCMLTCTRTLVLLQLITIIKLTNAGAVSLGEAIYKLSSTKYNLETKWW